ncbi:MAG: SIMPL domain-containing protein [Patescibacteria group bacterium]
MFNSSEGNKILRYGSIVLIVLAVFLAVQAIYTLMSTAYIGRNIPAMNVITVNGVGEKLAVPNVATFSFGAEMTGETVALAQKVVTEKINKALDIVKATGVEEKDIKTISYNVYPHYEYTQNVCSQFNCPPARQLLTGYDVSQTIEVKVRDTAKAGELLGQLGAVEITNLSGLTFTIDEKEKIQAEARAMAIADAREKAKILVKDLGVRLGRVVNFSEGYSPEPMYKLDAYAGMGGDASGVPVPQVPVGENTFVSSVSITYEIR